MKIYIHFLSEFQKTKRKLEEKSILFYRNGCAAGFRVHCVKSLFTVNIFFIS